MKKKWIDNPLFIVGHPKSGTSLLTALLDSHPELVVLPEESDFYNVIWNSASLLNLEWRKKEKEKKEVLLRKVIEDSHFKNYFRGKVENDISGNLDYKDIDIKKLEKKINEAIEGVSLKDRKGLFISLVQAYTKVVDIDETKIKYWVEKTPKHLWYIKKIKKDFPNAKIIFVYRDPRDNYLSYKKKWPESLNPTKFSKNWNESFDKIVDYSKNDLIKVKYEDLIFYPNDVVSRLTLFMGIKFDTKLLIPTKNGKSWKGNSMFGVKSKSINSESVGRYKENLTEIDIEIIEAFCKDKMIKYGYTLDSDSLKLKKMEEDFSTEYDRFHPIRPDTLTTRQYLGRIKRGLLG